MILAQGPDCLQGKVGLDLGSVVAVEPCVECLSPGGARVCGSERGWVTGLKSTVELESGPEAASTVPVKMSAQHVNGLSAAVPVEIID